MLSREEILSWVEDEGISEPARLARRIAYVLTVGLISCAAESHAYWDDMHATRCRHHLPLRATWETSQSVRMPRSFAETNQGAQLFGLAYPRRPLQAAVLGLEREKLPCAQRLEALFTGWGDHSHDGPQTEICLHREDIAEAKIAPASHDIDSFIYVTRDPSVFRGPLSICLSPQPTGLLSKSIHVQVPIAVGNETKQVPVHRIPHIVFARQGRSRIYLLFPRLYQPRPGRPPAQLRDEQHRLFFEGLILPSFEAIGAQFQHHVPNSYESVVASSRAAVLLTGATSARGSSIEVPYHEENLQKLWPVMARILRQARRDAAAAADGLGPDGAPDASQLWQFGDPIFVYDGMDMKLLHQSPSRTVSETVETFLHADRPVRDVGDEGDVASPWPQRDQLQLVDIASEFLPTRSSYTVLARRCCQYNTLLFLYGQARRALFGVDDDDDDDDDHHSRDDEDEADSSVSGGEEAMGQGAEDDGAAETWAPPKIKQAVTTEYPVHLLRDSVSITSEPRPSSPLFRGGVRYIQSYTVAESTFNVAGIWPFSHPNLYNLAHSDATWGSLAREGHISADRQGAERALSQSCALVASNLRDRSRAYGWRFEVRLETALARAVQEAEASLLVLAGRTRRPTPTDDDNTRPHAVAPDRDGFFCVHARVFNSFLWHNIDKHLRLMDYILSRYNRDVSTPQSAAALYALAVLSLQQFISAQKPAIARILTRPVAREADQPAGLGMAATIARKGFGFFPQLGIDWHELALAEWLTPRIAIPQLRIKRYWREEQSLRRSTDMFDRAIRVAMHPSLPSHADGERVMDILAQFVLREYKRAVYFALFRQHARDIDQVLFTLPGLRHEGHRVRARDCQQVRGNRSFIKSAWVYFAWAFTDDDVEISRHRTEQLAFRTMMAKSRALFDHLPHTPFVSLDRFLVILYYRFCQQVLCFPNPDKHNGTLSCTDKAGNRMVFCTDLVYHYRHVPAAGSIRDPIAPILKTEPGKTAPLPSPYPPTVLGSIAQIRRLAHVRAD